MASQVAPRLAEFAHGGKIVRLFGIALRLLGHLEEDIVQFLEQPLHHLVQGTFDQRPAFTDQPASVVVQLNQLV